MKELLEKRAKIGRAYLDAVARAEAADAAFIARQRVIEAQLPGPARAAALVDLTLKREAAAAQSREEIERLDVEFTSLTDQIKEIREKAYNESKPASPPVTSQNQGR